MLLIPKPAEVSANNSQADERVFNMKNFRREWIKACVKLKFGVKTGPEWYEYEGLIPHDFRRSAVRNLINAGVGHATAMKITGHRRLSVFERYNIVSTEQLHAAVEKVKSTQKQRKTRRRR